MNLQKEYHLSWLSQMKALLQQFDDEQMQQSLSVLDSASIGQHFRHIIEFYQCLFSQLLTGSTVDYDLRIRNLAIECSSAYALGAILEIEQELMNIDLNKSLELVHCFYDEKVSFQTTIGRELIYLAEHNIHHFALIKIGLCSAFPWIVTPSNFGVAPSTVKHRESLCVS